MKGRAALLVTFLFSVPATAQAALAPNYVYLNESPSTLGFYVEMYNASTVQVVVGFAVANNGATGVQGTT